MKSIISLLCFVALMLSGCGTKMHDLNKPIENREIILKRDFLHIAIAPDKPEAHVRGLLAGTYRLVGSNENGDYYVENRPTLLCLFDSDGYYYVKNGSVRQSAYTRNQFPRAVNIGGLLISNRDGKAKVTLFFLIDVVPTWEMGIAANPVGGAVIGAVSGAVSGSIQPLDFTFTDEELQEILTQLK